MICVLVGCVWKSACESYIMPDNYFGGLYVHLCIKSIAHCVLGNTKTRGQFRSDSSPLLWLNSEHSHWLCKQSQGISLDRERPQLLSHQCCRSHEIQQNRICLHVIATFKIKYIDTIFSHEILKERLVRVQNIYKISIEEDYYRR